MRPVRTAGNMAVRFEKRERARLAGAPPPGSQYAGGGGGGRGASCGKAAPAAAGAW